MFFKRISFSQRNLISAIFFLGFFSLAVISSSFCSQTQRLSKIEDAPSFLNKKELSIGYQSHSINDLREWRQLVHLKGTNWLKIDFFFEPSLSGSHFLMTHNTPIANRLPFYYTEDDLLKYITDFAYMFKTPKRHYIAICFKYSKFSCDSNDGKRFMEVAKKFFESVLSIIEKNQLNLEIILDGALAHKNRHSCLSQFFRPLVKTFVENDPLLFVIDKEINNNDKERGYDLYQVLDLTVPGIDPPLFFQIMEKLHFGKYRNSSYPWLWWEPHDQEAIHKLLKKYQHSEFTHEPGFNIVINIDPFQYKIFSSNISRKALQAEILPENDSYKDVSVDSLQMVESNSQDSSSETSFFSEFTTFFTDSRQKNVVNFRKFGITFSDLEIQTPAELKLIPKQQQGMGTIQNCGLSQIKSAVSLNTKDFLIFGTNAQFCEISSELVLKRKGTTSLNTKYSQFSKVMNFANNNYLIESKIPNENANKIDFSMFDAQEQNFEKSSKLSFSCNLQKDQIAQEVSSAFWGNQKGKIEGLTLFVTPKNNQIFGMWIENVEETPLCSEPFFYSAGGNISLALLQHDINKISLMEVHTHGFCFNCEKRNKDAHARVCDLTPEIEPFTQTYSFADVEKWKRYFTDAKDGRVPISPCNNDIIHGVYDFGSLPVAILKSSKGLASKTSFFMSLHKGLTKDNIDLIDSKSCAGKPNKTGRLILDVLRFERI